MNRALLALVALLVPFIALTFSATAVPPRTATTYASNRDEPAVYEPCEMVSKTIRQKIEQTDEKLQQFVMDVEQFEKAEADGKRPGTPEQRVAGFCKSAERNFTWFAGAGSPTSDPRMLGFGGRSAEEIEAFVSASKTFAKVAAEGLEASKQNDLVKVKVKLGELNEAFAQARKVWLAEIKNPTGAKADGPIILDAVRQLGPFHKNGIPGDVYYQGQPAQRGTIDLIPSSAFYKGGFKGDGVLPAFPNEPATYVWSAFQYLTKSPVDEKAADDHADAKQREIEELKKLFRERGSSQRDIDDLDEPNGAFLPIARWHLYCPRPGDIKATIYLKVSAEQAREPWIIEKAEGDQIEDKAMTKLEMESQTLKLQESDGTKPQPMALEFHVKQAGRVSFYLNQTRMPRASGSLAFIRLRGSAIDDASLLRVRFRPNALHMKFRAPKECPNPIMWVIESKPVGGCYAFAPITTLFGYYGHRFTDVYVHKGAALHFSMWGGAKLEADGTANMAYAPRIIASNNPRAREQISSAEGITVRGMNAFYTSPARSVIQAMRITRETDGARTYWGYLYDEERQSWRLYTAGQMGARRGHLYKDGGETQVNVGLGDAGSFVEVPGPFNVEMSGDIERRMARRIWFYGSDEKFYPAAGSVEENPQQDGEELDKPDNPADEKKEPQVVGNVSNAVTLKTADGWTLNIMGGMAFYKHGAVISEKRAEPPVTPVYLKPEKARALFEVPVTFGEKKASKVTQTEATIDYQIVATGPHSKATLYYGPADCNAHIAAADAEEAGRDGAKIMRNNGWKTFTPQQDATVGLNQFRLKDLVASTTYYFRLYIEHDDGRSWDCTSGTFKTEP